MDGPIPGSRPRDRPHSRTCVIRNAHRLQPNRLNFGSQYRWLSEGQEIVSDVTVGRFYQILNLPCCEMRDIVYFHAHTGPSMELRSPRTRQNRPKSQNGGPYKGHPETGEHNYKV